MRKAKSPKMLRTWAIAEATAQAISIKKAGFNINYLETAALHLFVTGSFAVTIDKERAQDESD